MGLQFFFQIVWMSNMKYPTILLKVKLLIFLRGSTESRNHFTAGVCYIAKTQYNILRLDTVLKIS
jgi:hypothetical protein